MGKGEVSSGFEWEERAVIRTRRGMTLDPGQQWICQVQREAYTHFLQVEKCEDRDVRTD